METAAEIPRILPGERVSLQYEKTVAGDDRYGFVPYYHFKILSTDGTIVGHINLRIGNTRHVQFTAGHIGYEILPEHRGHSYSLEACRALAPLVRRLYREVILTTDPDNRASLRIIEKLGARYLDEVDVPREEPAYEKGVRRKVRFRWTP